jgi:hypothetical protein
MSKKDSKPEMAEFESLITSTMREKRVNRHQAAGIAVKKYPKLHARVVREANEDRPAAIQHSRFRDIS